MDELVKELRNTVLKKNSGDDYLLMNSKYIPLKIEAKNYHTIHIISDVSSNSNKQILFVDGGNNILFESAGFCVGFIRVGGIVYRGNIRIKRDSKEFYILVKEINGKYHVKTYPEESLMSSNPIIFDPDDESLRNGSEKCNLAKIISVIRRFSEIELAKYYSQNVR